MHSEFELRGPRNELNTSPRKASSGRFGVALRTESDGDDETGRVAPETLLGWGPGGGEPPGKTYE
eukprot:9979113-Alexandrium_andersonii.AAC.1